MLLIFPPVAKPSEPPAGIAKLAGALASHGLPCHVLDMNLELQLSLLASAVSATDTWGRRAVKNRAHDLIALRDPRTYRSRDRYSRAVTDLSRSLELTGKASGVNAGLADYHDIRLSPVRSADLLEAARRPEQNLYYPYFKDRLRKVMSGASHGLVGLSLNYLSQALTTFAMIGFIKQEFPGTRIVLGGGLVTSWMKRPGWKDPFSGLVEVCVAGPGEGPLLSLHGIEAAAERPLPPAYTSLPMKEYLSPGPILPYAASTGCFWNNCSFCPEPAENNPYLPVPAPVALSELTELIAATRPVLVHLLDNAVSPALLRALAHDPPGVPWYGFARIGRELADPAFCAALRASGCAMLKLGLESGDQGVLDRLGKGIDLETASLALANLHRSGIAAYVYLLFGTPAETVSEARRTLEFVVKHREAVTFLNLAVFNLPLCSKEADHYATEAFYEGDLSLYRDFRHPQGWDRKFVRQFLDAEFKKHPAIAAILRNDPPVFTSNHAAFFSFVKNS